MIVSGINRGANLGHDVFYSGTVAAAREGALYGIRSIAVSLCLGLRGSDEGVHWKTAANFVAKFVPEAAKAKTPVSTVLNINVPNLLASQIKGFKLSRQGRRMYEDVVVEGKDPRQKKYYWVGGPYKGFDNISDSDCVHIDQGFISLVPLKTDTTDLALEEDLRSWESLFNNSDRGTGSSR
jgi:5'-nucleotidase